MMIVALFMMIDVLLWWTDALYDG